MKRPWLKWYAADWRAEPLLRMISRAARSYWLDLIGLMHEAVPYGHLLIKGRNPSVRDLCAILGDSERDAQRYLDELEGTGVYSKTDEGVIYSRRMVRDHEKELLRRERGRTGGNPALLTQDNREDNHTDNLADNRPDNVAVKAQIPDTRYQKPEREKVTSPKGDECAAEFEPFWKSYPRTPNMSKAAAFKAWKAQRAYLPPLEQLLATVSQYKQFLGTETRKRGREYPACHAQRWLSERRWESYLAQAEQAAATAQHTPDWADTHPQWLAFKRTTEPQTWHWLKAARLVGGGVAVRSGFEAQKIQQLFADKLHAHFGEPITITVDARP